MSNPVHTSVGVIIAIVANTWTWRIVPPFIWGVLWCARLVLLPGGPQRSRTRSVGTYYAVEYMKATIGSLAPALAIGSLKALFRHLVLG
jgi:hypothetical protein